VQITILSPSLSLIILEKKNQFEVVGVIKLMGNGESACNANVYGSLCYEWQAGGSVSAIVLLFINTCRSLACVTFKNDPNIWCETGVEGIMQ
jgi:hypothetical protein